MASPCPSPGVGAATGRPALCTVPRGARTVCAVDDGWCVGGALANISSNHVTEIRRDDELLSVHADATHPFEVWALARVHPNRLIAGTRTRGVSHLRLLAGSGSSAAHALPGRVFQVAVIGNEVLAVTSSAVLGFKLSDDGLRPALRSGDCTLDAHILTTDGADFVSGGFCGTGTSGERERRVWAVRRDASVEMTDPRSSHNASLQGSLGAKIPLRVSAAADGAETHRLVLAGEHGDVLVMDMRNPSAYVAQRRAAHTGWIASVAYLPDAIVTGGADGIVKVWSPDLQLKATLPHHADSVYGVAFRDSTMATVSYEGRVAVNQIRV